MDNKIITGASILPDRLERQEVAPQLINQGPGPQINNLHGNVVINQGTQIPPELLAKMNEFFGLAPSTDAPSPPPSHADEWAALSHDRFCLFVLDNENYRDGVFSIAKSRALQHSEDNRDRFLSLLPDQISVVLQMPCIFAKRNLYRTHTSDDHPVVYGRLTEVIPQGATIKFCFETFKTDYQQTINNNITLFGLKKTTLRNQLDEEHWAIRNGDLPRILDALGIVIE